ncbi:hypothetical protein [Sphingopyxis sp.]|jgi:hypothetical protein|uniref:hypothetical protein n=1 Tax=Sphingopyxis sp. TaxID=1908224 RepID=UPI002596759F|nr:hypothetical protein [uncultured Sphingopyxis sp.]
MTNDVAFINALNEKIAGEKGAGTRCIVFVDGFPKGIGGVSAIAIEGDLAIIIADEEVAYVDPARVVGLKVVD